MLESPVQLILWGLGVTAVLEGLILALAPRHLGAVLELLARLDGARRREIGLAIVAFGVILMWVAHG